MHYLMDYSHALLDDTENDTTGSNEAYGVTPAIAGRLESQDASCRRGPHAATGSQ